MGIMVYSLLWVMQDLYHQPYHSITLIPSLLNTAVQATKADLMAQLKAAREEATLVGLLGVSREFP